MVCRKLAVGVALGRVDDVDARGNEAASQNKVRLKGFAQTEAGGDGTYDGEERIVDGHLADGIVRDELVVERKADGGDTHQHSQ